MSDTADALTECSNRTVGVNEAVVMVQDVKFLKGLPRHWKIIWVSWELSLKHMAALVVKSLEGKVA